MAITVRTVDGVAYTLDGYFFSPRQEAAVLALLRAAGRTFGRVNPSAVHPRGYVVVTDERFAEIGRIPVAPSSMSDYADGTGQHQVIPMDGSWDPSEEMP